MFSNLLVDMENKFGEESDTMRVNSCHPQQVYNKLRDEVILFHESVKSIMEEMDPIKRVIIDKISAFIKQLISHADVAVYGSHATRLCLHWSDIDLVLKPSNMNSNKDYNTRNWLNIVYNELLKGEHRGWIVKIDFIENTTVPVIKLACSYQHMVPNSVGSQAGQLLLPNGTVPRYTEIVSKPINVDITLWSDSHNGLPCVDLVQQYLSETSMIEPIILVLKQMLKVWGFNDAYTGGLSSYAMFLMIVSFLQEKKRLKQHENGNIGEMILELLRYYAQLDISQHAICAHMPGEPITKENTY